MGFSVAINQLIISKPGVPPIPIPADKTTLSPPKLKRNWDVKQGFGIDGAFCVYTGEGLAAFDATFEFWDESKEAGWRSFAGTFLSSPSRIPAALGIYHPVLLQPPFKIEFVQVTEIEGWSLVTPGRWQARLSFLQFRAQKPFVPAKTEPGVPAVSKVVPVTPKTANDFRIANSIARSKYVSTTGAHSLDGFVPPYPEY